MAGPKVQPTWSTNCDQHGKRLYPSRKAAKAAIRELRSRGGMREYRCTAREGWHVGHLPPAVMYGIATTREVYGR